MSTETEDPLRISRAAEAGAVLDRATLALEQAFGALTPGLMRVGELTDDDRCRIADACQTSAAEIHGLFVKDMTTSEATSLKRMRAWRLEMHRALLAMLDLVAAIDKQHPGTTWNKWRADLVDWAQKVARL